VLLKFQGTTKCRRWSEDICAAVDLEIVVVAAKTLYNFSRAMVRVDLDRVTAKSGT
jgi:hypothetical protein